mmetsp:Transcript_30841/g.89705  ORF Transcript_30841/g.89705 Transcript_30841/m.89705 type:complete len:234 (-) Transcript_30841:380-1081(-)
MATASKTNARSFRSSADASRKATPAYFVASNTTFLSPRTSSDAYCNAAPWLAMSAPKIKSRSPFTTAGADAKRFQSKRTAARQVACRQLFRSTAGAPVSVRCVSKHPCFSAATAAPCNLTARAAISALTSSGCAFPFAWSSRHMASSSVRGKSFVMLYSFRNLSDDLSFIKRAALALVKKKRPAMSKMLAARANSNKAILSTSTNFASHRVAPHSIKSLLGKGVMISPAGLSL